MGGRLGLEYRIQVPEKWQHETDWLALQYQREGRKTAAPSQPKPSSIAICAWRGSCHHQPCPYCTVSNPSYIEQRRMKEKRGSKAHPSQATPALHRILQNHAIKCYTCIVDFFLLPLICPAAPISGHDAHRFGHNPRT